MNENPSLKCIICEEQKNEGEGIKIVSEFICEACETEMVQTDVMDVKYPFFIHQMKQIFTNANS